LSYNVRHGFPFSTYGETALILVQNIAIASLVLKYSGNTVGIAGWIGGLMAAGAALFNPGLIAEDKLSVLQAGAGVLGVASKVPQILTIWKEGGTGQLSAFAVSLVLSFLRIRRLRVCGQYANVLFCRSSTISSVLSLVSSRRCRKLMIRSFSTASLLVSHSTLSFLCR
jgi:hypothetical protein